MQEPILKKLKAVGFTDDLLFWWIWLEQLVWGMKPTSCVKLAIYRHTASKIHDNDVAKKLLIQTRLYGRACCACAKSCCLRCWVNAAYVQGLQADHLASIKAALYRSIIIQHRSPRLGWGDIRAVLQRPFAQDQRRQDMLAAPPKSAGYQNSDKNYGLRGTKFRDWG